MSENKARVKVISSMLIYGSIGLFVRYIPLPSAVIAMVRGFIGAPFVLLVMLLAGKGKELKSTRERLLPLCLSGMVMGFNWILLFEAYRYTSVAAATLCYYMAPIFIVAASPFLFKEKLGKRKIICIAVALLGMVLVSGSGTETGSVKGVIFALGAALLYATVVSINKLCGNVSAYARTFVQLASAAVVLLPYNLLTGNLNGINPGLAGGLVLLIVGIIHTGFAYYLYFGSVDALSAQSLAILSYIDPVTAVLLSALILREPLTLPIIFGAVLILGSALISELPEKA